MGRAKTIALNDRQRRKAEKLLEQVEEGLIENPEDIVSDWVSMQNYQEILEYTRQIDDWEYTREREFIPVSEIAGTTHSGPNVIQRRMENVLKLLLAGDFEREHEYPPKLEKIGSKYYVSVDGHHRVIAFKALGLEEMYVEFVEIPSPETCFS